MLLRYLNVMHLHQSHACLGLEGYCKGPFHFAETILRNVSLCQEQLDSYKDKSNACVVYVYQ